MIRPILTQILLFLTPFALYALFLAATRAGILDLQSWPLRIVAALTAVALVLMAISFVMLAQFSGAPAGSFYVPPHVEDGRLVPGHFKER